MNFADDGRSVVRCDWDGDGDLDFWIANRTAPQIRFLRNETPAGNHFLALVLTGTNSNRDAIGAQVRVELSDGSVMRRAVRAGEGFLGQSSKVVHFGMGQDHEVRHLEVRWPNGSKERFPTPTVLDTCYRAVEGTAALEPVLRPTDAPPPSQPIDDAATIAKSQPADHATQHLLNQPLPLPRLEYTLFDGQTGDAAASSDRPVLLNLWASWCQPCLKELDHFSQMAGALQNQPLRVVALSVDGVDASSSPVNASRDAEAEAESLIRKMGFPFGAGMATPQLLDLLQLLNNTVYKDDHRPLPVPVSFLIDKQGRLAAIYKGPVSSERLLRDAELLEATATDYNHATLPFPGRWLGRPGPHSLSKLNARLWDYGLEQIAVEYAARLPVAIYRKQKAELLLANAIHYRQRDEPEAAQQQLDRLLELEPDHPGALLEIGTNLARRGDLTLAVEKLTTAIGRLNPPQAEAHLNLGVALRKLERPQQALHHLRRAIELDSDLAAAHGGLGLLLASQHKFREAADSFESAVRLDSDDVEHRVNLAVAWMQLDRLQDSLAQLTRAVELDPDSVVARIYRSEILTRMGRINEARAELDVAVQHRPEAAKLWFRRGELAERQGDMRAAVASFQKVLQLSPNQPTIATRIAWILATVPDDQLRNGRLAVQMAEQAADATERKVAPVLDVLAAAYAEVDRFAEAIATAEQAIRLLQNDGTAASPLVEQIRRRLDGYREKKKFRNTIRQAPTE